MKTNLSVEKIKQALSETDGTIKATAAHLGVKYVTLQYWLIKHKIPFNNKNKINATSKELWEEYQKTNSIRKVAEKFNCTHEGVRCSLKNNGYKLNELVIYSFDKDFFFQDSEKLFYWMGFIAADGCVKEEKLKNSKNPKNPRYVLSIGLAQKDKRHLEKFIKDIGYNGPIRDYLIRNSKRNENWNDTWKSEVKITITKELFNKFSDFNIVPRKSLTYTFPEWILEHKYLNHFMRGYFDGDGSFYTSLSKGKKAHQKYFSLRGTSEFLLSYRNVLEEHGATKRTSDIRINNNIGVLEYGGNDLLNKIVNFLYKDATVYLDRKHTLAFEKLDQKCYIESINV